MKRRVRHLSHPLFFLPVHLIFISANYMKSRGCCDGLKMERQVIYSKSVMRTRIGMARFFVHHDRLDRKCPLSPPLIICM